MTRLVMSMGRAIKDSATHFMTKTYIDKP